MVNSKPCAKCKLPKPLTEFYKRSGTNSYVSECKDCMKKRNNDTSNENENYLIPRTITETLAINYLHSNHIPSLPGKALHYSHVDVVCF